MAIQTSTLYISKQQLFKIMQKKPGAVLFFKFSELY